MAELGPATCHVAGTIEFIVAGIDCAHWLVNLDVPGGAWTRNPPAELSATADTRLYAVPEAFRGLVQDASSVRGALARGTMQVSGQKEKFGKLSRMLASGGNSLVIRCAPKGAGSCRQM